MLTRLLAATTAAVLAPALLVVPAAQADQTWSGQVTVADPQREFSVPEEDDEGCAMSSATTGVVHYDTVSFAPESSGPHRIVLTQAGGARMYVYRNGVCAATAYWADSPKEEAAGILDIENVRFDTGDRIDILIPGPVGATWALRVRQPGLATAAATGKGEKYLTMPARVRCDLRSVRPLLTERGRKGVEHGKVRAIVVKTAGVRAKITGKRLRKAARKGAVLRGVPIDAMSVTAVVELRSGKRLKAKRSHSEC